MNKKINHIIVSSIIIGTISGVVPANNFILGTTKAYAATYKDASTGELSSLAVSIGSNNEIKLSDTYTGDEISLTGQSDYYVQLKSGRVIQINAEVKGSGYVVKAFDSSSRTEKGEDVGEDIKIDSTYKDICLRTYKSEADYEKAYDNGDVTNCEKTYTLHVRKSVAVSEKEEDRDYAYFSNIHLSDGNISFSKKQTSYDVNVNEDVDKITVKATPEDDEDTVEINGNVIYKEDNFEKTISLDKGNNTINVYVENADEDTTYTLNVYRGKVSASSDTIGTTSSVENFPIQSEASSSNGWQRVDGKWRYRDGSGDVLKNQWWFDKNTGINYYLKENGDRATGWLNSNNNWYYFNENGEMKTGWINVNKNWYYLNMSGAMKMGWLEDSNENWYYLDGSGAMKTGWIENSDGKWYYLDSTGKMIKNSTINEVTVGADGAVVK